MSIVHFLKSNIWHRIPFHCFALNFRSFDIDNHINVCPSSYRGRSVTEANIQDYISNIVSKYLQVGLPPWQICVIPVVKSVPLARPDESAAEASTSAESATGNDDTEEEQHHQQQQSQPISSEQTTVRNELQDVIEFFFCMCLNRSYLSHTCTNRARRFLINHIPYTWFRTPSFFLCRSLSIELYT